LISDRIEDSFKSLVDLTAAGIAGSARKGWAAVWESRGSFPGLNSILNCPSALVAVYP
jgi:hypothetical protein